MKKSLMCFMLLSGCSTEQQYPVNEYLSLYRPPAEINPDERSQKFVDLYNNLKTISVSDEVGKTYAENFYFNDTLVTLHRRKELIEYLENTQNQLQSIDLKLLNILIKGEDVFLQWDMQTKFEVLGASSDVRSFGMSHLRFDQQGKIILHQDYWDSTAGFFQQIPLLGGVIKWIKNGLH